MSLAANFVIGERLHQSAGTRVFRGTEKSDGRPVIIKMLSEHALPAQATQLRGEHELLLGLALPGIPRVHSLCDGPGELALVLEDDGGESLAKRLAQGMLPLADALDVTAQVAEILGQLHSCGVIHKDLNPNNILIRRDGDGKLHASLIDFNLATMLPRELPSLKSPEHLEGTLAYLAPEQSGRMGRTVDYRADLYSLGVTLFQLLTGQLPFASRDALELLHCHIARLPPLASSINLAVPVVLSRIVSRLMAKTADERYRSAFGVRSDLDECRRQLASTGQIVDFQIAQHDPADRFLLPERLYGRTAEVAALEAALSRVQRLRRPELFLVSGAAGIGKSAVIGELHKSMVLGGVFIAGKFEQLQRDSPYAALLTAIGQLLRRILSESEQSVAAWRRRLGRALSGVGAVLIDVLPELGLILGPQPPLPEVPPSESRIRFRNAFARLMRALNSSALSNPKTDAERSSEPLVLFLDDLQWADAATLELLPQLLTDPEMGSLLLIGAYRDGEVGAGHPLTAALTEIEKGGCPLHRLPMPGLSEASLSQLVADTLSVPLAEAAPLARLVAQKTEGNALHAGAFLTRLYKDQLLTFDPDALRWRWDLERIAAAPITDNVVEMLAQRLEALPESARSVLQLGACIGGRFSRTTLPIDAAAAAAAASAAELSAALAIAVAEGFLLPQGDADAFVFAHDRLQQAAYSTLDDATRRKHHAQIGRALQSKAAADTSIFELTRHLNQASELLTADERLTLCELNLQAGTKARAAAAFATAFEHFSHGVKLLPVGGWKRHYAIAFALQLGQAECTYLSGRSADAAPLLDQVLAHAQGHDDKARIYFARGVYFRHIGDTTLATWAVLDGLKEFGIDIPRSPSTPRTLAELLWTQRALGGRSIEQLLALPAMTDARQIAILRMLSDASASAYFVGPNLLTVLLLRIIRLSLEQGNHALSAVAYVFFAAVVGSGLGDFDKGEQMGQLALRLVERYPDSFVESQVKCIYVAIANHFKNPVRAGSQLLIDSWRRGEESGNLTYAVYAVNTAARWSYLIGEPLDATHADCDRYMDAVSRTHHEAGYQALNLIRQVVRALQGKTVSPTELSAPDFEEDKCLRPLREVQMRVQVQFHNNFRAALCLIFGQHREGLAYCQKNEPDADQVMLGLLDIVEHYHVYALLLAGQAQREPRGSLARRRLMWKLAKKLRKLKRWAETAPQNFRHRYLMARAEQRRLRENGANGSDRAISDYQEALTAARAGGFLRDEALCLERMGELLQSKQLIDAAQLYLRRARAAYRRWGAHAKVAALETAHPELLREEVRLAETLSALHAPIGTEVSISSTVSSPMGTASALDLPTVLKATQALSSELTLDKLLLRMMNVVAESAGAQTAALVLAGRVVARFDSEKGEAELTEVLTPPQPLESVDGLVPAIVLYAMRRQQRVLLDDAVVAGEFSRDPVVVRRRPRSVLCLPLMHQGEARGALYLENNLAPTAFTAGRAELLATLCTQMAISIDNATLYAELELKVAERTGELRAAQARLLRLERETTETQMAGGFAHEMRNALTGARMLLVRGYRAALESAESEDREGWSLPLENSRTLKEMFLAIRDQLDPEAKAQVIERIRLINGNEQQLHNLLEGIDRGLGRSLGLTRLLLEYAQVGHEQPGDSIVSLRQVVDGLMNELQETLAKDAVAVAIDVPAACRVRAAPEHLDSIVRNLVLNAHDALREQEGERRLEISVRADASGESWELRITDSGIGIPDEVKKRLFEPFFSTKPLTGTGLGLSTVRKLVTLNGGDIRFESTAGRGTTFIVSLPIYDGPDM